MKSKPSPKRVVFQKRYQHLKRRLLDRKSLILSEQLPYQVISTFNKASVRYYASQQNTKRIPLVLVSPLSAKLAIYDLFPYRSLVRYLSDQGFDVYLIDWGRLNRSDAHLDFDYFSFQAMPALIKDIKKHASCDEISLQGWSMAGIFCTLYAASGLDTGIRNLLIFASPIDAYASGPIGAGYQKANLLLTKAPKPVHDYIVHKMPNQVIHTPGFMNALGFKLLNPAGIVQGHLQLLKKIDNLDAVKTHATLGDFLNDMIDYPGAINKDMLFWVWLKNPLRHGKYTYRGKEYDLKSIISSLLVVAGTEDKMVTADSVKPLMTLTSSMDTTFEMVPGGHLGLMCSKGSAEKFWPFLTKWLEERSILLQSNE